MLGHQYFSYDLITKYRTVFATLFNDIVVVRKKADGTEDHRFPVPVTFSAKRAWYARINQDPGLDKKAAITLPMIGFDLINIAMDNNRRGNPIHRVTAQRDSTSVTKMLAPIPFDLMFELYVGVKNHDDGYQIMEQITSFFVPDFTLTLKDPTGAIDYPLSVPIIMGNPTKDESYKTDFSERQSITWNIPFTMKAWVFGPTTTQGLIREVMVDLLVLPGTDKITPEEMDAAPRNVRITVTPNPSNALPEDNWTYNTTVEDFYDGKKFDPTDGIDKNIP